MLEESTLALAVSWVDHVSWKEHTLNITVFSNTGAPPEDLWLGDANMRLLTYEKMVQGTVRRNRRSRFICTCESSTIGLSL